MNTRQTATDFFEQAFRQLEEDPEARSNRIRIEIAEQIYLAMQRQNVTRSELAASLGKSRSYVSMLLRGTENLTIQTLDRIAGALKCELRMQFEDASTPMSWSSFLGSKPRRNDAMFTEFKKSGRTMEQPPAPTRPHLLKEAA